MKKLISLLLSAVLVLSFASCAGDDDVTSSKDKTTNKESSQTDAETEQLQTEIVTDENGETSVIEIPKAPTEDEKDSPDEDTDASTQAKDTETEDRFEEITTFPIEKNPLETLEDAELIYAAYDKMKDLKSFVYTSTVEEITDEEYMKSTNRETYLESSSGLQYALEVVYDGDVSEGVYYKDGCAYQTIDGVDLKQTMPEGDFLNYILGEENAAEDYLRSFERFETSKDKNGATVTFFGVDIEDFAEIDVEYIESLGGKITVEKAEGYVKIDKDGYVYDESLTISIKASANGVSYTSTTKITGKTENVNSLSKVDFPSFDGYKTTDCLEGLYRLTNASYAYDMLANTGMRFEADSKIVISGAENVEDISTGEMFYCYNNDDTLTVDMSVTGSLNGAPMSLDFATDGKNIAMKLNEEGYTIPYDDEFVWGLLTESVEYTFGYASAIEEIEETKEAGKRTFEYTINDEAIYYLFDKVNSCLEKEITYEDVKKVDVKNFEGVSVIDKYDELVSFENAAEFTITLNDGSVYNVQYNVSVTVIS